MEPDGNLPTVMELCTQVIPHGPPIPSAIRSSAAMKRCCKLAEYGLWRHLERVFACNHAISHYGAQTSDELTT